MTDQEITSFEGLPLADPIQNALRELGYATPSPIQSQAIPPLLEGRDLLGAAQTGTGKTAAFALPILNRLCQDPLELLPNLTRALILTPTRELASQVAKSFAKYGRHCDVVVTEVTGGVSARKQISDMRRGVDVLVATPGRLLDLCQQRHIDLSEIEFFVLDEADRMLDMGFMPDIKKIVAKLPQERQSLFFSATMSRETTELASRILENPVEVRIAPEKTTAEMLDHRICFLNKDHRMDLLLQLLDASENSSNDRTLVFSRTKHGADKLSKQLAKSQVKASAIHGNKSQGQRTRALEQFRAGRLDVLVATDVAARGIDVKGINLVVNYDLPDEAEAYVHRIGRTARAGESGRALSFCTFDSLNELKSIEKLLKADIPVYAEHDYHCEHTEKRSQQPARSEKFRRKGKKQNFRGKKSFGRRQGNKRSHARN